ncbi:hypothetical protein [Alsobacter sp. R-9]
MNTKTLDDLAGQHERRVDAAVAELLPRIPGLPPRTVRRLVARAIAAADRAEAPLEVRTRLAALEREREVVVEHAEARSGRSGLTLFGAVAEIVAHPIFPFSAGSERELLFCQSEP